MPQQRRVIDLGKAIRAAFGDRVLLDTHGSKRATCPGCGADCMRIGITTLAYTFEVCDCRRGVTYDHLVEQLWHRACLAAHERGS